MNTAENLACFGAPNEIAKSVKALLIRRVARLVRREGLDYEGWRYVAKKIRQLCRLKPAKKGRKLPNVLTAEEFRRFYQAVDRAANAEHALMLRLLFYTAVRVAMEVSDVDLDACRIRINEGKGSKHRVVLFGKSFATALRAYLAAHPKNRYLFQTRLAGPFTSRRIEQIVKRYAEAAGVKATPHTFQHQAITWLTRHSGMADAELQLITGLESIKLASLNQPGPLFVGQSLNPLGFHDRGYLVEQVDRENECLFIVSVLVKHDSRDRCHLLGNPGMSIDFDGEPIPAMRVDCPEPPGDGHHPGVVSVSGCIVETSSVSPTEAFPQIDACQDHGASFALSFRAIAGFPLTDGD